jgi:hypothetical protein
VHDLLLDGKGDELARFYPNLTAEPDPGDPLPAFRAFARANADELAHLLATRSTQTNEIGRCALLVPILGLLAREVGDLAHLDVGASAGLNLLFDRYEYVYDPGGAVGGPSPVRLECGTRGSVPVPPSMPRVVQRCGLDRSPVDVHDAERRRWLEACVWPDQIDRFERLRAALDIAAGEELDLRRGDAVADTRRIASSFEAHPVVTNTWVLNYLTGDERRAYLESMDALGAERDMSWIFLEAPALVPELPVRDPHDHRSVLALARWRDGQRTVDHLGIAHPHGYWLHWERGMSQRHG